MHEHEQREQEQQEQQEQRQEQEPQAIEAWVACLRAKAALRDKLVEAKAVQRTWVERVKDIRRDFPSGFYAALTNLSMAIAEAEMLLGEDKRRREREDAAYVARKREQARREGWRFPY